jgi:hypothetical protein
VAEIKQFSQFRPDGMRFNKVPMTIQVGVCGSGSIVLVSDTKVRNSERVLSNKPLVQSVAHQQKVVFGSRYNVAVAMAGEGAIGTDPAKELADHLSGLDLLPEDYIGPVVVEWGNAYAGKHLSRMSFNPELPLFSLLVVTPDAEGCRLCKLFVGRDVADVPSSRYLVNGHDNSPAIFWLEWMRADDPAIGLEPATGIAITTVLTAGELNPYGIGGIEVHQFSGGLWKHWTLAECDNAIAQHKALTTKLKAAVASLGPPVPPPQP